MQNALTVGGCGVAWNCGRAIVSIMALFLLVEVIASAKIAMMTLAILCSDGWEIQDAMQTIASPKSNQRSNPETNV